MHWPEHTLDPTGTIDWSTPGRLQRIICGKTTLTVEVENPKKAQVVSLRTHGEKSKRKGTARAAMEHLCSLSDHQGAILSLLASPLTKKTRLPRLVRFYDSLGFRPTGRTGNWAGDPIMVRQPVSSAVIGI